MTNPALSSEVNSQDPAAALWQPRQPYQNNATASGSDKSGYARVVINGDGQVTTETGKPLQASSADSINSQNANAGVPWVTAQDPVYRSRQSPSQVTDDSILTFPDGRECTLRQARDNNWVSATNGAPNRPFDEGQDQPEDVHPDLAFDLLPDEAADRDYSALVESTGGAEQMQAIQQIVETGDMDAQTLGALASQLRCEPGQLAARAATIMKGFEDQARTVMSEGGLNSDAVVAYAQQKCPEKLKAAMNRQATMRQTAGYAEIRQDYLENLGEYNPSAALNADLGPGTSQFQDHKGRVMVRIPGMGDGITWKSAIKTFGVKKS